MWVGRGDVGQFRVVSRTNTTTAHAHGCHSMPTRRPRRRHDETSCKLTNNQTMERVYTKNESNYCPRLVNWSVLDVKKLYFLFEAILEPLLQSLPGSVVVPIRRAGCAQHFVMAPLLVRTACTHWCIEAIKEPAGHSSTLPQGRPQLRSAAERHIGTSS